MEMLNDYFGRMVPIIRRQQGCIDKFIGDGLMAVWGTLVEDQEQERRAVTAAIEMQTALLRFRQERPEWCDLKIGVGINAGVVSVGNIGSPEQREFTVIGDPVNVASRIEVLTRELGVDILITEDVYNAIRLEPELRGRFKLLSHTIRGRGEQAINLYAVLWDGKEVMS